MHRRRPLRQMIGQHFGALCKSQRNSMGDLSVGLLAPTSVRQRIKRLWGLLPRRDPVPSDRALSGPVGDFRGLPRCGGGDLLSSENAPRRGARTGGRARDTMRRSAS
jgi:hypothetical protein